MRIVVNYLPSRPLTFRLVAEELQRPLYRVVAGDLGIKAPKVESALQAAFDRCSHWNAVLIDEADVFLEQRSMTDVHRNSMVAVFLRKLE